ncbi:eosinophil peroxidase [Magallana gigas]|uniref:eosinophil peroxidase n=1 Tax=Magallana gigas TaxID=29159 RepID=UPI003341C827
MKLLAVTCVAVTLLAVYLSTAEGRRSDGDLRKSAKDAIKTGEKTLDDHKKELKQFKDKGIDRKGKTSKDRHSVVTQSRREADHLAEAGLVSVEVTKILTEQEGLTLAEVSSSPEVQEEFRSEFCPVPISCSQARDSAYRSVDGSCNNLNNPHWGAAVTPQPRYQPAQYDDGVNSPRTTATDGSPLPSPRLISNNLFRAPGDCTETDHARTLMVMAWGQFIDHDIVATPVTQGDGAPITCCGTEVQNRVDCLPIPIPSDDPHFNDNCMEFVRSAPAPAADGCEAGPREQINQITSFIDGGVVYGDTNMKWLELVDTNTGSMLTSDGNLLPSGGGCRLSDSDDFCQLAGDHRVNVIPSLGGNHLVFVREHNRIVEELRRVRPDWDAATLFQETRKIIGALLQQINYREFLPSILREEDLVKYNLKLQLTGHSSSYNSSRNPAAKNVFNAAAFRFGHSQVPGSIAYVLRDFMTRLESTPTESTLLDPHMLITRSGRSVADLARFVVTSNSMKVDSHFEDALRDHLFEGPDGVGFDLGALNLQRGRDHGLPPYNAWRQWCGLPVATSFSDLPDMSDENKAVFADLYSDVDDIDVFAGGVAETPLDGAAVGPLFSCIIGNQFRDMKEGDRYWYENRGREGFRREQLAEIRKVQFAKILCDNLGVDPIQPDVFHVPNPNNSWQSCQSLPGINFSAWKRR